jgi:hypothetical protein|tara:strand:- start:62 stop:304 length:243 start_codon:yes stop_codon:yes gene_type:complete
MNGKYDILFLGTPFIDGHYDSVQDAYEAKETHVKNFPNIDFAIVKTIHEIRLEKNIFWIPNKAEIEAFNKGRTPSESKEI